MWQGPRAGTFAPLQEETVANVLTRTLIALRRPLAIDAETDGSEGSPLAFAMHEGEQSPCYPNAYAQSGEIQQHASELFHRGPAAAQDVTEYYRLVMSLLQLEILQGLTAADVDVNSRTVCRA